MIDLFCLNDVSGTGFIFYDLMVFAEQAPALSI
jgi:hypothetical protein